MKNAFIPILALLGVLLQAACSNQAVYTGESFSSDSPFRMRAEGEVDLQADPHVDGLLDEFRISDQLDRPYLDRLGAARNSDPRLSTSMSRAYLQWRYADVPGFAYRAAESTDSGATALIVFRMRRTRGLSELRICEILVHESSRSMAGAVRLLRQLIRAASPDIATALAPPGSAEREVVKRSGFLPAPALGPTLTVRPLNWKLGESLTAWSTWRFSIGDLEVF